MIQNNSGLDLKSGAPAGLGSVCLEDAAGNWLQHDEPPAHGNAAPKRCSGEASLHSAGTYNFTRFVSQKVFNVKLGIISI